VDKQGQGVRLRPQNSRIQVFTGAGKFCPSAGLVKPTDISFDAEEIAYVSEQRPSISVLEKSGKVLARFDTPGVGSTGLWWTPRGHLSRLGRRAKLISTSTSGDEAD